MGRYQDKQKMCVTEEPGSSEYVIYVIYLYISIYLMKNIIEIV